MEDEVSALAETLRKAAQKWASELVDKPPYWEALAEAAMPTLRAALAPAADDAGEVEAIRGRLTVAKFSTDSDWTYEIHADGVRIASGNPPGNPQTMAGSTAKIDEMVERANAVPDLLRLLSEERARRVEWQPIETAPRDGRYILAIVGKNDSQHMAHLEGRVFAVRPEPFGTGWSVYPGYGGAPSVWFTCWKPLDLPATNKDTQDE